MVFVTGAEAGISNISSRTLLFLVLSGLATGASWLCYFHALQKGDVNKVVPIDKSSIILTIVLAFIFLKEDMTLLMNHINSVKRPGLGNKSPYELVEEDDEDFKALMSLLKMHLIPPDEVHLMPDLFVKK